MVSRLVAIVVLLVSPIVGGFSAASVASVLRVELDGSGDFTTIQPAINAATSGDTILVGPGWYQAYERVQVGAYWYRSMAYWDDAKDIAFIGSGVGATVLGPSLYEEPGQFTERFSGIHSSNSASRISISGISFVNLHLCINGQSNVKVQDSAFEKGETAVAMYTGISSVESCSFVDYGLSVGAQYCTSVVIANCTFSNAKPYFYNTAQGVIRHCVASRGMLAHFYQSSGTVSNCLATPDQYWAGIAVSESGTVEIHDNQITGGKYSLLIGGAGTSVMAYNNVLDSPEVYNLWVSDGATLLAYGNDIYRGVFSTYMVRTEGYGVGATAVVDMGNNHWGSQSTPELLDWRIYDSGEDPEIHVTVNYLPIESAPVPAESTSWGSIKSMFR